MLERYITVIIIIKTPKECKGREDFCVYKRDDYALWTSFKGEKKSGKSKGKKTFF